MLCSPNTCFPRVKCSQEEGWATQPFLRCRITFCVGLQFCTTCKSCLLQNGPPCGARVQALQAVEDVEIHGESLISTCLFPPIPCLIRGCSNSGTFSTFLWTFSSHLPHAGTRRHKTTISAAKGLGLIGKKAIPKRVYTVSLFLIRAIMPLQFRGSRIFLRTGMFGGVFHKGGRKDLGWTWEKSSETEGKGLSPRGAKGNRFAGNRICVRKYHKWNDYQTAGEVRIRTNLGEVGWDQLGSNTVNATLGHQISSYMPAAVLTH